jgi:hypothetical protein
LSKSNFIIVFAFTYVRKSFVVHNKKRENLYFLLHGDFSMGSYSVGSVTKHVHNNGKVITNRRYNADP